LGARERRQHGRESAITTSRHVIENPISGERIVIRETAATTGGVLLAWELFLAPGGRVPSSHAHPEQQETFTVLEGTLSFRLGRRGLTVGAGQTVTVPVGTVHSFANRTREPVHVLVETRPALDMQALLETAAAMAKEQRARGRSLPSLLDLALFMRDFRHEVRAPYLPERVVRAVTRSITWLAAALGLDDRYRGLRAR
jgi:quercetin dioxygenase-like cupin family protein